MNVADVNDYVDGKPPHYKMIVKPTVWTTPHDLHLVATMKGLKKPKVIELHKKAQFVDLVYQVFYHRHEGSYNCWRVTLAVFPKRLHRVSSSKMQQNCLHKFAVYSLTFNQHSHLECISTVHERKERTTPNGCTRTVFEKESLWLCLIWQWLFMCNYYVYLSNHNADASVYIVT